MDSGRTATRGNLSPPAAEAEEPGEPRHEREESIREHVDVDLADYVLASSWARAEAPVVGAALQANQMKTCRVRVAGIGCPRCVREITAVLRDVPGVTIVTVDVAESVVCLGGTMTADRVLGALAAASYDAELIPPS